MIFRVPSFQFARWHNIYISKVCEKEIRGEARNLFKQNQHIMKIKKWIYAAGLLPLLIACGENSTKTDSDADTTASTSVTTTTHTAIDVPATT